MKTVIFFLIASEVILFISSLVSFAFMGNHLRKVVGHKWPIDLRSILDGDSRKNRSTVIWCVRAVALLIAGVLTHLALCTALVLMAVSQNNEGHVIENEVAPVARMNE